MIPPDRLELVFVDFNFMCEVFVDHFGGGFRIENFSGYADQRNGERFFEPQIPLFDVIRSDRGERPGNDGIKALSAGGLLERLRRLFEAGTGSTDKAGFLEGPAGKAERSTNRANPS